MNNIFSPKIIAVIESLRKLSTIGKKSSQRLALHLLDKSPETAIALANSLLDATQNIGVIDVTHNARAEGESG